MAGASTLVEFFAGVALLLWATATVRRSVERAAGARIRTAIGGAVRGKARACAVGALTAFFLQSSAATGLLVAAFAEKGLLGLASALSLMLGADLGSSLVVMVLSVQAEALRYALVGIGAVLALTAGSRLGRDGGRAILGIGLILVALNMIVAVADSFRDVKAFVVVMESLDAAPLMAFLLGGVLAWIAHSSVAMVLLLVSMASAGVAVDVWGVAFVLGANVGSGFVPAMAGFRIGEQAKRVLIGNIAFRATGAFLAFSLIFVVGESPFRFGLPAAQVLILCHVLFNLGLALVFAPVVGPAAWLLRGLLRDKTVGGGEAYSNLRSVDVTRPDLATQAARREAMRLADTVEFMLNEALAAFHDDDDSRRKKIKALDDEVDRLQDDIKLYLSRLLRANLKREQKRECRELLTFTTNLEHVGDIVDNGLLKLAKKRRRSGVQFSESDWSEIEGLHARVVAHMHLAVSVYATRDLGLATELMTEKEGIRTTEHELIERHIERLMAGHQASVETSDIHLDVLRDLTRITAYLTSVCYPILQHHGVLRPSRLAAK